MTKNGDGDDRKREKNEHKEINVLQVFTSLARSVKKLQAGVLQICIKEDSTFDD